MGEVIDVNFGLNKLSNRLVRITASWCMPCKSYAPTFDKVAKELDETWEVNVFDIDDPAGQAIVDGLGIRSVPATIITVGNETPSVFLGVRTEEALRGLLKI